MCHALSKGLLTINQEKDNSKDCSHFFSTKHSQNGGGPRDYSVRCCVFDITVIRICTDDSNLIICLVTEAVSPSIDYLSFTVI